MIYHINICGPINKALYYACPTGNVGGCETSMDSHSAHNMGFLTSDPIVNEDGTISVLYTGKYQHLASS